MTITNCWKLFCYGVKRDHYDKLIGTREFLEQLAQDFFNNKFSSDIWTPEKNIHPLDEFDDGDTVSTCRALQFSSCISPSAAVSTIYDLTRNSASTISIGYESWLRLCTTFAMGMTITNYWKLFCYRVKRDHYDKLISIRKFLDRLAQDNP